MKLTAVILTRGLSPPQKTLKSVSFADETLIISDKLHPLNSDFAAQRNYALNKAKGDWVLFVDDDEIVSPQLAKEINKALTTNKSYLFKRYDSYYNHLLTHGESGHNRILRLAQKNSGVFIRPVHEVWHVTGPVSTLSNPLLHVHDNLTTDFIDKIVYYGPIDASCKSYKNRYLLLPIVKFIVNYFFRLGFVDGALGLFHAYLMSIQSLSVRIFQWQKSS